MEIDLIGFSVVVVAQSNNPTILNPDFLRHNGIVSSQRPLLDDRPPFTTPLVSEVAFEDGLVVKADPTRVTFEQTASPLAPDDVECSAIAKGYLKTIPHVPYTALGFNPKAVVRNPPFTDLSKMMQAGGDRMTFDSISPRLELKAAYKLADSLLSLTLHELPAGQDATLICEANIHRDVEATNQQMRVNSILSILEHWHDDLDRFYAVVNQVLQLNDNVH